MDGLALMSGPNFSEARAYGDSETIDPSLPHHLVPREETITVFDRSISTAFSLGLNSTIGLIKSSYENETHMEMKELSYKGILLRDNETLYQIGIGASSSANSMEIEGEQDRLIGVLRIEIREKDLEKISTIEINDSYTVQQLKEMYNKKEKRNLQSSSYFILYESNHLRLNSDLSLYENNIRGDTILELINLPFNIVLNEKGEMASAASSASASASPSTTISIYDHFTIREIKEAYNLLPSIRSALSTEDKLIYNKEELSDNLHCYKLNLTEGSVLYMEREDITIERFEYICADCGSDVRLKKTDAVRCRECGYRIVYKKRTTKPCQYLAR